MKNIIKIHEFCKHYEIPHTFIESLYEYELIEIISIEKEQHIDLDIIADVEKYMRLHYDLNINFEGLDVVSNLLKQIESLQSEIHILKNKLAFYEDV